MANEKRLIDANALRKSFEKLYSDFYRRTETFSEAVLMEDVLQELASHPTVDAVEVVRCRDCKHTSTLQGDIICKHWTEDICVFVKEEDFCSYGERRTDANNLL